MSHIADDDGGVDRSERPAIGTGAQPVSISRRAAACASLLLFVLSIAALLVAAIRGMPELLLPLAAGALGIVCAWAALVRRRWRRTAAAVLALLAWTAGAITAARWSREFPLALVAIAGVAASGLLAGVALRAVDRPAGRLVRPARSPVLIINPHSGGGTATRTRLAEEAGERGIDVVELGPDDDLAALAREQVANGSDCLGMAGGDGSLAVVADIAMGARLPFVCVPAGTRNHFALDLGLDRTDPIGALDAFGEAIQRRIDVASVNGRRFLNNVSIGAYGAVVSSEDYRDNKLGVALSMVPDLVGPEAAPMNLRFTDGDGVVHHSAVVVHVSNNSYELAPGLGFGSRPSLVEGHLGVVAVVQGDDSPPPRVLQWQSPSLSVASDLPVPSGIDGEFVELDAPVCFDLEPLALRVRIPRSALGVSPAARRPALSARTWSRLVEVSRGRVPVDDVTRFRDSSIR